MKINELKDILNEYLKKDKNKSLEDIEVLEGCKVDIATLGLLSSAIAHIRLSKKVCNNIVPMSEVGTPATIIIKMIELGKKVKFSATQTYAEKITEMAEESLEGIIIKDYLLDQNEFVCEAAKIHSELFPGLEEDTIPEA